MQQIRVEEHRVTRVEFAINEFVPFLRRLNTLQIGSRLLPRLPVINAAEVLRTSQHLQAAVGRGRLINGDHAASHIRIQTAKVVPIAIILMPFPRSTDTRFLENHLVVVVINFVVEQPLHRASDPLTAHNSRVRAGVVQFVPQCQPRFSSLGIAAHVGFVR